MNSQIKILGLNDTSLIERPPKKVVFTATLFVLPNNHFYFSRSKKQLWDIFWSPEKRSKRTTNETVFPALIHLSVGTARQNALCSADNTTKAETAAVRRLSTVSIKYHLLGAIKRLANNFKLLRQFN